MTRPAQAPTFKNPPVVEVVLGIRFRPLPKLNAAEIGRLWSVAWRETYPDSEQKPLVAPEARLETLDDSEKPDGLRLWFLNGDRSSLIQVQQDRFICNWRKVEGTKYPRYRDSVRPTFEREFGRFLGFLHDAAVGSPTDIECEVTYVNHLRGRDVVRHSQLEKLLAPWSGVYSDEYLPPPEDVALHIRHAMEGGRLVVSVLPGFPRTGEHEPIYRLSLTARVKPAGEHVDSILQALDQGHDWVVNGFVSTTTSSMHEIWGKENSDDRNNSSR